MSTIAPDSPLKRPRRVFRNIHILQILSYRLPAAGVVSILHRISGAALFLLLPWLLWLLELSLSSELSFVRLREVTGRWWVKLILLGVIWACLHHLVAGVRFLMLDLHLGIDKAPSHASALAVLGLSVVLTAIAGLRLFGVF
jgi:succinate dehydrogenase / fumarate reductase cytochrome b subunit